ncbi:MAG: DUF790 family protein [Lentisphaeria bacterium]|nr:DUF790 family protein [Lentisphaeria bacterium]
MLNREHLRYTFRSGKFHCRFVDVSDENNLRLASALMTVYADGLHRRRCELAEMSHALVSAAADRKFASGLEKLVLDMAEFANAEGNTDYPALRRELFSKSGKIMGTGEDFSETEYRRRVAGPPADIYGDLPDFELLTAFRELEPGELPRRYNTALVQGLLMNTSQLTIALPGAETAELRKLVKFMKFFRLLAEIAAPRPGEILLQVSGPFALLENSRKYALQLASFFPAVLKMKHFRLEAEIRLPGRTGKLILSEKDNLVSHYRELAAYVPEEIRIFHRVFRERCSEWTIVGETPFINTGGEICFPDLSFRRTDGRICHLELFHRWHRGALPRRLAFLDEHPRTPLILGVDRAAVTEEGFEELRTAHPAAAERLFRFRDFPAVETLVRTLDKAAETLPDNTHQPTQGVLP